MRQVVFPLECVCSALPSLYLFHSLLPIVGPNRAIIGEVILNTPVQLRMSSFCH